MCHEFAIENVEHLLMHCPFLKEKREAMFNEISTLERHYDFNIRSPLNKNPPHTIGETA